MTPSAPTPGTVLPNGDRVRELRDGKNWTQGFLAEKADCSKKTIENIEAGRHVRRAILEILLADSFH